MILFLFFPTSENGCHFLGLTMERKNLKDILLLQACMLQHVDRDQHVAPLCSSAVFPRHGSATYRKISK